MAVDGEAGGLFQTAADNAIVSSADVWELPPSNVFGKVMLGSVVSWPSLGPLSATVAVLSARTQQADGSVAEVPLSSNTDDVTAVHMFYDPKMTEITFGLQVRNGIAWAQDLLTFFS
jgi:hypothetical protein